MGGWGVGAVWGGNSVGDYWGRREVVRLLCIVHWMDCYLTGVYVLVRWLFIVLLMDLNLQSRYFMRSSQESDVGMTPE